MILTPRVDVVAVEDNISLEELAPRRFAEIRLFPPARLPRYDRQHHRRGT